VSIPGLARAIRAFLSAAGLRVPLFLGGTGRMRSSPAGETLSVELRLAGTGSTAWTNRGRREYARAYTPAATLGAVESSSMVKVVVP